MLPLILILFSLSFSKDLFTLYGDIFQIAIPIYALTYSYAKEDKEGIVQLAGSYGITMGITYTLKYTVSEERPNGGEHSFPSGHTSSAFAGAWYLQKRYGRSQGVPALILAFLVGASRVHAKAHYIHDVLASILISFGVNHIVVKRANVELRVDRENFQLSLLWRW